MFDIDKINNIVNMLNKDYKKTDFRDNMLLLESEIIAYLEEINFNSNNLKEFSLGNNISNEVLENNLKKMKENSYLGLFEGIGKYQQILYEFLSIYHIGFLSDFYLMSSGLFKVVIPILISKPSFSQTPCSDKINFDEQLETLEKEGIILRKGKRDKITIPATNINKVKLLLEKIEAKHIKIDIKEDDELILDRISFFVSPDSLDKFTEEKTKFVLPISDKPNADEIENIYKMLKDMASAIVNAKEPTLKDVCGSLLKSYFSNICDILGINTILQQEQKEKYKKDKEFNKKQKELKSQISKLISGKTISQTIKKLNKNLDMFLNKEIDFHISQLEITPFNTIKVCIKPIMSFWLDDDILMDEKTYKSLFETYKNANRENYLLVPLMCDENIEKIKEILKKEIPDIIFESFRSNRKKEDYTNNYFYYISEIEFVFSDFLRFL